MVKKAATKSSKSNSKRPTETVSTNGAQIEQTEPVITGTPPAIAAISTAEPLKPIDLSKEPMKRAVAHGLAMIGAGKSKADAARAIYAVLATESKDTIVAAFIAGATLTEKGALTYWYNCKRRASKKFSLAG